MNETCLKKSQFGLVPLILILIVMAFVANGDAFWNFGGGYVPPSPAEATKSLGADKTFDSTAYGEGEKAIAPELAFDSWAFGLFGPFSLERFRSTEPTGFIFTVR